MSSRPALFFYRDAWDAEPALAVCSEGAQYLWFKMLLLMNECEPRGYMVRNGKPPSPAEVAALTRTDPNLVEQRLAELAQSKAFSRNKRGVIYSRRMVRDENRARICRENGKKGGNPSLKPSLGNETEIPPSDNPPDNTSDNGGLIPLNSRLLALKEERKKDSTPQPPRTKGNGEPAETYPAPHGADHQKWIGKVIRLDVRDHERWAKAYHTLDLIAHLQSIDDWLASEEANDSLRKRWFHVTSGALRNRHEQALAELRLSRAMTKPKPTTSYFYGL